MQKEKMETKPGEREHSLHAAEEKNNVIAASTPPS